MAYRISRIAYRRRSHLGIPGFRSLADFGSLRFHIPAGYCSTRDSSYIQADTSIPVGRLFISKVHIVSAKKHRITLLCVALLTACSSSHPTATPIFIPTGTLVPPSTHVLILTPTSTPFATDSPEPSNAPAITQIPQLQSAKPFYTSSVRYADRWSVYRDDNHGFSFEYPLLYDKNKPPELYKEYAGLAEMVQCAPFVVLDTTTSVTQIFMGEISIVISETVSNLDDYLTAHLGEVLKENELTVNEPIRVDSVPGRIIEYRHPTYESSGAQLYSVEAVIKQGRFIVSFVVKPPLVGNATCDLPDAPGSLMWEAYFHLLETFPTSTPCCTNYSRACRRF